MLKSNSFMVNYNIRKGKMQKMCHKLAENIIKWCEKTYVLDEYGHIKAVYGMEVVLENFWKLIGFLLIGSWAENKVSFFAAIASFTFLRIWAGGKHFNSSLLCFVFVALVGLFPSYVIGQVLVPNQIVIFLYIMVFGLILLYAPYISVTANRKRKIVAFVLALVYLLVCLLASNLSIRNSLLVGCTVEALTLIKGGKGNEKREDE